MGDVNSIHVGVNTDFNMTSIFAKKVVYPMEPDDVWQMRVDYNGSSKEMLIRWYKPPVVKGSTRLSFDLCAALTNVTQTTQSSSGSGSGSNSSSSGSSSPTDLWSPSFGQLVVGFTSAALPPPPGRMPSPVALSSWTFRFTDTDFCNHSPVLPCGMGTCSKARSPWDASVLLPSCKCALKLPSFEPTHLTGLPSCFPEAYTCRQLYSNPCAPGVCIDGVDGSYSCLCPLPYFPFAFSPKGTASCSLVQAGGTRMPTFLSQFGLTCPLILNTFGLTQTQFFSENKGFQCRAPIPADTLVNVTSRAFSKCTAMYTVNYGDTCDSINALFNTQIEPLNPALSCSDGPRHGQLLCVAFDQEWYDQGNTNVKCNHYARITPATPSSSLQQTAPYTVESVLISELESPQTCQGLWQAFSLASPTRFFQLNPGLPCDSLLPDSPLQGNFVTESTQVTPPTRFFQLNPAFPCDSLLPDSPLQGNTVTQVGGKLLPGGWE
ncbi:unnamed protein product [Closterium sp. NIES-65]|nr:unnamed protein product [Closterium sp. NIES-65]